MVRFCENLWKFSVLMVENTHIRIFFFYMFSYSEILNWDMMI